MTYRARWYLAAFLIILIPSVSFAERARSRRGSSGRPAAVNSAAAPVQAPSVQSSAMNEGSAGSGTSDTAGATPGSMSSSPTQIYVWKDKHHVMHAVNNLSDVPPGYRKPATASTDPKQPVVRLVPDATQPGAAQPPKKGAVKNIRQSSVSTRHKAGRAQERPPDFREKQERR